MGRFYKINQHGPIEDYAYELPFKELFTMQKYKRAEEEKADEALKAGYDKILNLNYKPGDEAKVAQLRKNFENLSNNVYKKYGNNLANATSSINQGISEVMDAGLMSDINANYKTWTANEAAKASLYASGQFQPNYAVDQQGARPTEDAQGRRRDYDQYLASTDIRPNQQEIYDDIPIPERTWSRLQESARKSALQYGMSHPQDLIQRYGPSVQPLLQAAQMGDPAAQQELYKKSLAMLEETLPEFVNNAAVDGSTTDSSDSGGGDGTDYFPDHSNDLVGAIRGGESPNMSTTHVRNAMGLDATDAKGNYVDNAIPLTIGENDLIVNAGRYDTGTDGFMEVSPGVFAYGEDALNRAESSSQKEDLAALNEYYDKYETHLQALQDANQSATLEDLEADPNLDKTALLEVKKRGLDPNDPNTRALYDTYKEREEKLKGDDPDLEKRKKTMLTALAASGMSVDFKPLTGPGNTFITLDDGKLVLNIKGVGIATQSQIDNLIKTNRSFGEGVFGPDPSTETGPNPFNNPWNEPPGFWGGSSFSLVGKDNVFQKLNDSQVVVNEDNVKAGDPLYQFDMAHQVPLDYQTWRTYNEGRYQGTGTDSKGAEYTWKKNFNALVDEVRLESKINEVQLSTKSQMDPIVKVTGRGNNKNYKLTGFEPVDVSDPDIVSITPENEQELTETYSNNIERMTTLQNTSGSDMEPYMNMYTALYESLSSSNSIDKTDPDTVEEYATNLRDFYNVNNYLEYEDPVTGQVGDVPTAMNTLIETSEFTYDTGVVDDIIKDPVKLKKYTTIKAEAKNLIEIDSGNLKNIGVSGDLYGPYTTGRGIQVLNAFNTELERQGLSTTVTSAFRTQSYNETLPESVEDSLHLSGKAFDLRDGQGAKALYERWKSSNGAAFGGLIKDFHTHNVGGVVHYHIELK